MPGLRPFLASALLALGFVACDGDVLVGEFVPAAGQGGTGGVNTTATSVTSSSSSSSGGSAGASECVPRSCDGVRLYECGNCVDDDGEGDIDSDDPDCLGPCHNSESLYFGNIPGQSGGNCERECYFDSDSGVGNDDCRWDMRCDAREPEPDDCPYDSELEGCEEALVASSQKCLDSCLPLVPNGCDCFGCCRIPGAPGPVWLGSEVDGAPSCDRGNVADPEKCRPCTLNTGCFNPCDECEICVGKPEPPPNCGNSEMPQECPPGSPVGCGLPGQSGCSVDYYCITGCCTLILK